MIVGTTVNTDTRTGELHLKPLKTHSVLIFSVLLLTACATTPEPSGGTFGQKVNPPENKTQASHKNYYGKWTLIKIVYQNGDIRDLTEQPVNYVHIKENEISEVMPGYGVRTYNYIEKDNTLLIMAGNRLSTWKIVKSTQNAMEIETSAGRYVLVR